MSKKDLKKKNIEIKKDDLENVSGGVNLNLIKPSYQGGPDSIAPVLEKDGGYYPTWGDHSLRFDNYSDALKYSCEQHRKRK